MVDPVVLAMTAHSLGGGATQNCFRLDNSGVNELVLSSTNKTATLASLVELESSGWIDGATTVVTLQYVVANMPDQLLQVAQLTVEFTREGGVKADTG